MKRLITLAVAVMTIGAVSAQQDKGGITEEMMAQIRLGQTNSAAEKAARNALAFNSISELATNADNLAMIDTNFSHRVKTSGITNQYQSGRCWLFTGLNVLRADMIEKYDMNITSTTTTTTTVATTTTTTTTTTTRPRPPAQLRRSL